MAAPGSFTYIAKGEVMRTPSKEGGGGGKHSKKRGRRLESGGGGGGGGGGGALDATHPSPKRLPWRRSPPLLLLSSAKVNVPSPSLLFSPSSSSFSFLPSS